MDVCALEPLDTLGTGTDNVQSCLLLENELEHVLLCSILQSIVIFLSHKTMYTFFPQSWFFVRGMYRSSTTTDLLGMSSRSCTTTDLLGMSSKRVGMLQLLKMLRMMLQGLNEGSSQVALYLRGQVSIWKTL